MQLAATIIVIALASGFLLRAAWRAFFQKKAGCGSGCGKCAAPDSPEEKTRFPLPQA